MKIELALIAQNPNQVRAIRQDESLTELAESIREHGLLQPVKVRPVENGFELVYGHRRVAAMRLLKWVVCEAIVEGISEDESLIQSIAENLQRQNLDILDEARSYQILRERGFSLREIAELVKKPSGRISNRLSILQLPTNVQDLVVSQNSQHTSTTQLGGLSADSASRIATAAASPDEALRIAEKAIQENLRSSEVRELTRRLKNTHLPEVRRALIEKPWAEYPPMRNGGGPIGKFETPQLEHSQSDSPRAQFHRKLLWNLKRIDLDEFDHFTIGYSERKIEDLIELLEMANVTLLADVRHNPVSRFHPEYSKKNLSESIVAAGMEYAHFPELGIPTERRRETDRAGLFEWYDRIIEPGTQLKQISGLLRSHRIAFMCVEIDPKTCHRHRISQSLESQGLRLLDL